MSTDPAGQTIHPFLTSLPREEQFLQKAMSSFVRSRTAPVMVGAPEDLDIDDYNEENIQAMQCDNVETVLKSFAQARITTMDIVRKMRPADFDRQGRHPFLGVTSLEAMLKLIYRHAMLHQRDIRRVLDQGAPIGTEIDPQA